MAWRVHRWQLACFSFPLEEEGDHHDDVKRKWREEWDPANFQVIEGPIFRWLQGFMDDLITKGAIIPVLNDRAEQLRLLFLHSCGRRLSCSARYTVRYSMFSGGCGITSPKCT